MNNFLVIAWKRSNHPVLNPQELQQYLQAQPDSTDRWISADRQIEMHCFTYWPHLVNSRSIYTDDQSALVFDGIATVEGAPECRGESGDFFLRYASQNGPGFVKRLHGEFSIAYACAGGLYIGSNEGGSHPLFHAETDELIAFSNRIALLLGIPGIPDQVDPEGTAWLSYQGYVLDGATSFSAVKKLGPGDFAKIAKDGRMTLEPFSLQLLYESSTLQSFRNNPLTCFELQATKIISYLKVVHEHYKRTGFDLSLSGGKDSRMILSILLKAGLGNAIASMHTNGPLFSPEVTAAQDVAQAVNLASKHQINRPNYTRRDVGLNLSNLIDFVSATEGHASAYDIVPSGTGYYPFIRITGSQDVLHDDHFASCRKDSLEAFLEDVPNSHWHDPIHLLKPHVRYSMLNRFRNQFRAYHENGVPVEDLGYAWMLRQRSSNWTGIMQNRARLAGPTCFPLLHGDVYRFFFSLPRSIKDTEMVHFGLTYACCPELTRVPFANSRWKDTLRLALEGKINVIQADPYRSHPSFPDLRNPFISDGKVSFYNQMKPFMLSLLRRQDGVLREWVDTETAAQMLQISDSGPSLSELICVMGLWATLLCVEYGKDLFNRNKKSDIERDLLKEQSRKVSGPSSKSVEYNLQDWHMDLIQKHERSIADLSRQIRNLQKIEPPTSPSPAKPGNRGRRIYVTNRTTEPLEIRFEIRDSGGNSISKGIRTVGADSTSAFQFVSTAARACLSVDGNTLPSEHCFAIETDIEVYSISITADSLQQTPHWNGPYSE